MAGHVGYLTSCVGQAGVSQVQDGREDDSDHDDSLRAQTFPQKRGNGHVIRFGDKWYGRLVPPCPWLWSLSGALRCQEKNLAAP